jgi:hypothetical protein
MTAMTLQRIARITLGAVLVSVLATAVMAAGSPNAHAGFMPAYYDAKLFTINFKELPPQAERSIIAHNGQFNIIWQSDQAEALGFNFISVIDAIPGDGMNPLWREVQIIFPGAPFQLKSDTDVAAAAAAGLITLSTTNEVYRCSVARHKR